MVVICHGDTMILPLVGLAIFILEDKVFLVRKGCILHAVQPPADCHQITLAYLNDDTFSGGSRAISSTGPVPQTPAAVASSHMSSHAMGCNPGLWLALCYMSWPAMMASSLRCATDCESDSALITRCSSLTMSLTAGSGAGGSRGRVQNLSARW